jgi:PhoPQ-activated pathogenicity-related protein
LICRSGTDPSLELGRSLWGRTASGRFAPQLWGGRPRPGHPLGPTPWSPELLKWLDSTGQIGYTWFSLWFLEPLTPNPYMWKARVLIFFAALAGLARGGDYTALDRYVAAPDSSYRYSLSRTVSLPGLTAYQLDMVSQTWLTAAEVDRPEWHHWVTIVKPDQVTTSTALLYIDGGSNQSSPGNPDPTMLALAAQSGAVVVDLGQVPNEPLLFADETQGLTEDALVAYTWAKFLNTGDERWPARLPMTKAAVRAMDTTTAFLANLPAPVAVKNFAVAGGSKRGWTTWTTAAVDPRVIAIGPIVIDTLNVQDVFIHQWQCYGYWEEAAQDYVNAGIMNWLGTPQMDALMEIEDPYRYRERLTMPKYLVNSTGDQFFLPDDSQFYFSDLPGEKYLRYVPNTDHSMASPDAFANLLTWFQGVTQNFPRPRFYWDTDRSLGTMLVRVVDTPTQVLLWQATNPQARDFRLQTIGPAWTSTPLQGQNGIYTVSMAQPARGWTGFFVELDFAGPGGPLVFTTEVVVTPDVLPFGPPPGVH